MARLGNTDFTADRLIRRHDLDLANGIGNLVNRTLNLAYRDGIRAVPYRSRLPQRIDESLRAGDFRAAAEAITDEVAHANRVVETDRPWRLAGARRASVVGELLGRCRLIADELEPFLPSAAHRLHDQLTHDGPPSPAFARLGAGASPTAPGST